MGNGDTAIEILLLSNSENREQLKNFRNVACALASHNKFRIRKETSKPQTNYRCRLQVSYLAPCWLISRDTITFHKINTSGVHGFVSFTVIIELSFDNFGA